METVAIILLALLVVILFFWVRNLIGKLQILAKKRTDDIDILNAYFKELVYITEDDMWSGDVSFRRIKNQTELLVRYLQDDEAYRVLNFLYEAKN